MSEGEVAKIESVQRKVTKMVQELNGFRYYERLSIMGDIDS